MPRIAPILLASLTGLTLGCRDDFKAKCQDGEEGCSCSVDGECFGDLVCASGTCIDPSSITGSGTDSTTTSATESGTSSGSSTTTSGTASSATGTSTSGASATSTTDATTGSTGTTDTGDDCAGLTDEFEGVNELSPCWSRHMDAAAVVTMTGTQARLDPGANTQWFNSDEAAFYHKQVTGDFLLETRVDVQWNGGTPPGDIKLGGIMVRNPNDAAGENHVLWLVGKGVGGVGMVYERKNTMDSTSQIDVEGGATPSGADNLLRICRIGDAFTFHYSDAGQPATAAALAVNRPDLPASLQVGFTAYSANNPPEATALFEYVRIQANPSLGDCQQ